MSLLPQRRHYMAVFLASLALLMLEITVARVLTVALHSHYAFVAVSLAMFGLGLSGLVVYLLPSRFPAERADAQLVDFLSLFGLTAAAGTLAFLRIQVAQDLSVTGFLSFARVFLLLTVPFFFGGLCISLLMTHFSARMARIYFADLVGASAGCLAVVAALALLPAPQVAVLAAFVACATALAVALGSGRGRMRAAVSLTAVGVLLALAATTDLYTMRYVKYHPWPYSEKETWNSFSRVSAFPVPSNAAQILPMRLAPETYVGSAYPPAKFLDIDGTAYTPMVGWNGDPASIQWLKESVLYAAHELRPDASVLVIGTGGGRDLLAAIAYGQPQILGIEINGNMRRMVEDVYGDFTGRPYSRPGVEVIIDEARSRLSGMNRRFDILQLSLIDTFSMNAAGGFVFSENYLYTVEGFREYFQHLEDDGLLSVTRYMVNEYPVEVLRTITMARAAWEAEGATPFSDHIVVLRQFINTTILVRRTPFTADELARLARHAEWLNAVVLWAPGSEPRDADLARLIASDDWRSAIAAYPFLIGPPTDDRPFFFNFLRRLLPRGTNDPFNFLGMWNDALALMYLLIAVVTAAAVVFFSLPLFLFGRGHLDRSAAKDAAPLLLYFACLGYGFLMIEIPLLQKLMLLLGSPVYALSVVLFSLLLFSGSGSLLSDRIAGDPVRALTRVLLAIAALASTTIVVLPSLIDILLDWPIATRVAATVVVLAPLGLLLGMAYPLGIRILRGYGEGLVPWAWGLNGATSVVASVLAIFLGSRIGFTGALLTGVAAYLVGLVAIRIGTSRPPRAA